MPEHEEPYGDPFKDKLHPAPWQCPHGNGSNCECQLPVYEGLYVAPITFKSDGKTRHCIFWMQQCYDGGGWEFHDPITNEVVGCCGIYWGYENVKTLQEWQSPQSPPSGTSEATTEVISAISQAPKDFNRTYLYYQERTLGDHE